MSATIPNHQKIPRYVDGIIVPPHEHCWHDYTSQVIRPGKNIHGPFCTAHPDVKKEHEHLVIVHKQRCCRCPANRVSYEEFIDAGQKEGKKK